METREIIEDAIDYDDTEFVGQMYFEDLDLEYIPNPWARCLASRGFKKALADSVITIDEIVDRFKSELQTHL